MVITVGQNTAFFEANDQMAMDHDAFLRLALDGITTIGDLIDFDEESLKQVAVNLSRPSGRIPDPTIGQDNGAAVGATIPCPPFIFGAKTQARLIVATDLLKFYRTVGRDVTAANMRWDHVMRNFGEQWKAIKESKKESSPEVPIISKALPIIKWIEAFTDHCYRCIGHRFIPLAYVIREDAAVDPIVPPAAINQAYSATHGSILNDLIHRAGHDHGLFEQDNAEVYFKLEEATRGTQYADSIKPFQRLKNGRAAFRAMVAQYAGNDKWEATIKAATTLLLTRRWKGSQNFALEKFVALHRNAFVSLQACAEHVVYQLPNAHSRVGYILDAIESDDAGLQAAMANIQDDTGPNGKRGDFEAAVAYLLPKDPVVKRKHVEGKRTSGEISDTRAEVADFGSKPGIGKTGVHLRYHNKNDYNNLSKDQREELREWRKKHPQPSGGSGKSSGAKKRPKTDKKAMTAAIKKGVENELSARATEAAKREEGNLLMELLTDAVGRKSGTAKAASTTASPNKEAILNAILKRAQASAASAGPAQG